MSEFDPAFGNNIGEAVLFTPGPTNKPSDDLFGEVYFGSAVDEWAEERASKYAEVLKPLMMYVTGEDMHRVVWMYHTGITEDKDDLLQPYAVHHVVCDCVAEDSEPSAHPNEVITCCEVTKVLEQRAQELATEQGLVDCLAAFSEFDTETLELRLKRAGQELAIRAIAYLLEIDLRHPEQWMANKISGLHHVELLASFLHFDTSHVMPLLEMMEEAHIIKLNGDLVRLDKTTL